MMKNFTLILILVSFLFFGENHRAEELTFATRAVDSITGITVREVYKELNKELSSENIKIKLEEFPDLRALYQVNVGKIDGDVARVRTDKIRDEFPKTFLVSENLVNVSVMIVAKEEKIEKANLKDPSLNVGILRGQVLAEEMSRKNKQNRVNKEQQLFKILEYDRVDFILLLQVNGILLGNTKVIEEKGFVMKPAPGAPAKIYPLLNEKHAHLDKTISNAIIRLKRKKKISEAIIRGKEIFYSEILK